MNKPGTGTTAGRSGGITAKRAIITVVSIVALGLLIFAVTALSVPKRTSSGTADFAAVQANDLASQAEQLAASGDTTAALSAARKALVLSPSNARAKKVIDTLTAGSLAGGGNGSGGNDGSSGTIGTPSNNDTHTPPSTTATDWVAFNAPVADLTRLLPASIKGYDLSPYDKQPQDASVSFSPTRESRSVRLVLVSVHDRGTRAAAAAFIPKVSKVAFPDNGAPVTVAGGPGYFGTFGRIAMVSFVRGRFAYEVMVTTIPDPVKLKTFAEDVASKVPTSTP